MADKAEKAELAEWRRANREQRDQNLKTWIEIRDDKENSSKDRVEAAKNIARAIGQLATEKMPVPPPAKPSDAAEKEKGLEVSPESMAALDEFLKGLHGPIS
jgi:hypothetical protein